MNYLSKGAIFGSFFQNIQKNYWHQKRKILEYKTISEFYEVFVFSYGGWWIVSEKKYQLLFDKDLLLVLSLKDSLTDSRETYKGLLAP